MFSKFPALRRVSIYMVLSYLSLTITNNSGLQLENMWLVYTPMFVGVYVFTVDRQQARQPNRTTNNPTRRAESKGSPNAETGIRASMRQFSNLLSINCSVEDSAPTELVASSSQDLPPVPGPDLSSIKWEHDGEMSPQDTWNLMRQLSKTEEHDRASALLHLSSKHRHSKIKPRRQDSQPAADDNSIR